MEAIGPHDAAHHVVAVAARAFDDRRPAARRLGERPWLDEEVSLAARMGREVLREVEHRALVERDEAFAERGAERLLDVPPATREQIAIGLDLERVPIVVRAKRYRVREADDVEAGSPRRRDGRRRAGTEHAIDVD